MRRGLKGFLLVFLLLFLLGCNQETTTLETTTQQLFTVTLYLSPGEVSETHQVTENNMLDLPMLHTNEEHLYVGWSNGETVYSGPITVTEDLELTLVQELVSEAFQIEEVQDPKQEYISIHKYVGNAKYLTIPEKINNLPVRSLSSDSFNNSELIEVYIPNSIRTVFNYAFEGSADLEKVVFYGEAEGTGENIITMEEFNTVMDENSRVCTIVFEDEDGLITYSEECPYITSKASQEIVVNDVTYRSYQVTYDNNDFNDYYRQFIYTGAFKDCVSLETVVMPISQSTIFFDIFENNPQLVNLDFGTEQERYQIIDNIIYSLDGEKLIYYPGGLSETEFTIPDTVFEIGHRAFSSNSYLEIINIHKDVVEIFESSFYNLPALKEFNVDSRNSYYYDVDGVLYWHNVGECLFRYPQNKNLTTFSIPLEVDYIRSNAFLFNQNLESIDLGTTISMIENVAFGYTEKLTVLDIPSSVTYLGYSLALDSSINTIIIRRSSVIDGDITTVSSYFSRDVNQINFYFPDDSINDYLNNHTWGYYYRNGMIHPLSEYTEE